MAGLLDLFSGRSSDIYGEGLLTPEQRGGLGNIGLLALAGKLGQLAGPSFSPVPDFGAALGQAAGAYGASQEGAGTAALNAILTAQKGRKLQQELDFSKQLGPILAKLAGQWPGGDGSGGGEGSGSTGGGAAAPLGAGGGGGGGSDPRGMIPHITAEATRLGIDPAVAVRVARSEGLGTFSGDGGKSGGAFQLYTGGGVGNDFQRDTGLNPLDPANEKATITYALEHAAKNGWGAWNGAKKLGITGFAGIGKPGAAPTAAAPDSVRVPYNYGAPGGGLLAPTGPNPLSDADPIAGLPRAAGAPRPAAAAGPWTNGINVDGVNILPVPGRGASVAAPTTEEPPGFAGRQLVAQLAARPPIDDLSQYRQVAGPGAADAAAAPRAPLPTMGPAGIELPPMQGPLAAPAPAAAAPAAAGPGLLAPPGMPAAAALPRVNPAYDAYLRNLGIAGALAKGAGLPDVLAPLVGALKDSPAYRAQQIIAEKTAAQPFEQAQTLYNKQVEIAGVGPIEAAKLPYALAQKYFEAEQQIRTAGPVAAAQNFERIKADNAAKGIITTMGADGQIRLSIDPAAVKAVTGATITAPKQAEADIARETTRIQQEQAARYEPMPGGVPVMGADGKTTMMPMSRYEYDLRKRLEAERRGATSSGPQPGDIVAAEDPAEVARRTKAAELSTKQQFDERDAAEDARLALQSNARARPLVEKAILGAGADFRLEVGRGLKALGLSSGDDVVATQTFLINQLDQASRLAKRFGTGAGITERDVENAKELVAGSKKLEKQTILNTLDIVDQVNRYALQRQHEGYDRYTDNGKIPGDRSLYKVPIPIYSPEQMKNLPPGTPVIMPDGHRDVVPARK